MTEREHHPDDLAAAIDEAIRIADAVGARHVAVHLSTARDALAGRTWSADELASFSPGERPGDDAPGSAP